MTEEKLKGITTMLEFGLGCSSNSIIETFLGVTNYKSHPYDYSDFMRCVGVTRALGIDIDIMKGESPQWRKIVLNWDTLVEIADQGDSKEIRIELYNILKNLIK